MNKLIILVPQEDKLLEKLFAHMFFGEISFVIMDYETFWKEKPEAECYYLHLAKLRKGEDAYTIKKELESEDKTVLASFYYGNPSSDEKILKWDTYDHFKDWFLIVLTKFCIKHE